MNEIIIYIKASCPYCQTAKQLLTSKNLVLEEIDITDNDTLKQEMIQKANGRHTVPQIFINGQHIGGCDDLQALEKANKLDDLLKK
ncbi:glutaredoxin 3 [Bartonella sp. DGB1]|uniref:glutaredoxin 3 n=1 Tax=Bartonella sp. DGB1 TaxID=3239807 RepID=UPI0035257C98